MMSITLTFTDKSSLLQANFHPEIELDERFNYSCCLLDFYTYHSIPNVHKNNNTLHYYLKEGDPYEEIVIPVGSYEIEKIVEFINGVFLERNIRFVLAANKNTLKSEFEGDVFVDFSKSNSISSILGFEKHVYRPAKKYKSNHLVNIQSVGNIRIDCDLITGSFHNGKSTHTIHEFVPTVEAGCKISEQPSSLIYLPVIKRRINEVNISVVDQLGNLIDFRGEEITCRIHIKREV